ncbi:hypothetical protein E1202_21515 [Saccharopolyspora karakumensis]|uniref:GH26 domain-containing protein n=1 Tax=Saccharopolyspora karakumensis TaxID=2530386 RepID=A0A4V6PEY3_9PSEU|nr:hypothetical protein [Saccharopolyspora karakumensis]TDD85307.1 hypothetical protein E1202_21515 [Saccharopolyspora karakumensis]
MTGVDVASIDIWEKATPSQADYDAMRQAAAGRPIALGEVGAVPAPELLDAQPDWSYFMLWAEHLDQNDPPSRAHLLGRPSPRPRRDAGLRAAKCSRRSPRTRPDPG